MAQFDFKSMQSDWLPWLRAMTACQRYTFIFDTIYEEPNPSVFSEVSPTLVHHTESHDYLYLYIRPNELSGFKIIFDKSSIGNYRISQMRSGPSLCLSLSVEQLNGSDVSIGGGRLYYVPWYHSEDLRETYKVPPALSDSYKELRSLLMKRIVKRYVVYEDFMHPESESKSAPVWISQDALSAMENRQLPMNAYGRIFSFSDLLLLKPGRS